MIDQMFKRFIYIEVRLFCFRSCFDTMNYLFISSVIEEHIPHYIITSLNKHFLYMITGYNPLSAFRPVYWYPLRLWRALIKC